MRLTVRFILYTTEKASSGGGDDVSSTVFLESVVSYLLSLHDHEDKAVRYRVCMYMNLIMNQLSPEVELDEDMCSNIIESMLIRSADKVIQVRIQAVGVLARFPDECVNYDDEVTNRLMYLMTYDGSKDVRRAALQCIPVCSRTLSNILERIRDVHSDVRVRCMEVASQKITPDVMTVEQRRVLFRDALHDREKRVRNVCIEMICTPNWLGNDLECSRLFSWLSLPDDAELCQDIIINLLIQKNTKPVESDIDVIGDLIPTASMRPSPPSREWLSQATGDVTQHILCVLCYCRMLKKVASARSFELLDDIIDCGSDIADILSKTLIDNNQNNGNSVLIIRMLCELACMINHPDEVGRSNLTSCAQNALRPGNAFVLPVMYDLIRLYASMSHNKSGALLEVLNSITPESGDDVRVVIDLVMF